MLQYKINSLKDGLRFKYVKTVSFTAHTPSISSDHQYAILSVIMSTTNLWTEWKFHALSVKSKTDFLQDFFSLYEKGTW
jgi:hypothetical protein